MKDRRKGRGRPKDGRKRGMKDRGKRRMKDRTKIGVKQEKGQKEGKRESGQNEVRRGGIEGLEEGKTGGSKEVQNQGRKRSTK